MQAIKRFRFKRTEDVSGVRLSSISSLSVFDNIKELELIHGHEGRATIEWMD